MKVHYLKEAQVKDISNLSQFKSLCLDMETTGLQPGPAKPRLLQLCNADPSSVDTEVYVFDLFHVQDISKIKELVENRDALVIHNANFDIQFLLYAGIDFRGKIFDTFIAERVLTCGVKEMRYSPQSGKPYFTNISSSLKAVASRRLGLEIDKSQQVSDWSKDELNLEQVEYAAKDVLILPKIAEQQLKELKEESLLPIYSLESKCIRPVAMMCARGFGVDIQKLHDLKNELETALELKTLRFVLELDRALPEENKLPRDSDGNLCVGKRQKKDFNPGSGAQVIRAFLACGVEVPVVAGTGKPTLNQVALAEFSNDHPLMTLYRERTKLETRLEHVDKLIENINPFTHRIHSGYNQMGANSGRFTSKGAPRTSAKQKKTVFAVNIQQVPRSKDFRSCFVPTKGHKLVICDWAQIELRLAAELVNIPEMRRAFVEGIDLHTLTASLVYRKDIDNVLYEERQEGKTLNFALMYGMGYRKYKTYAAQSGRVMSLSEAKIAHAGFHSAYPRIKRWHQECAAAVNDGWAYIRTSLGRRRLLSHDDASMMCAANTRIQGAGADILKLAISKLDPFIDDRARMVAVIHDEVVMEVIEEEAQKFKVILEDAMVTAAKAVLSTVPAVADANIGDSWADK